ncbi:Polygalacturonase-1 non-catalytic subunit beta AroGP1 Polygalacturonase [Vigna angularis]|uniref:Polygalacturonase-1 non-catalytic subunit beta AroGP1 Polygalacturonase n=1 Tax=Phaseolus angularis TaxID=3914 RepID=A0A8T0LB72_PHAAN|nr:Polygalacturonase-1 non-catalytic subunit beta AroGP1 Polygalacturonase [Vigna angularis]
MNGGKVTKSVSCHHSLFPYLLYYCHSVPKVRVYEADLLDPESKAKINHGVAICHLDTTTWSPTHGAFVALGSGPGRIEFHNRTLVYGHRITNLLKKEISNEGKAKMVYELANLKRQYEAD